jgi:hypothetical protein
MISDNALDAENRTNIAMGTLQSSLIASLELPPAQPRVPVQRPHFSPPRGEV